MSKIFLSHTKTDKPFVRKLAADLRNYSHTVWIDEAEIKIGDSLIGKIREGLDSVDFVAVVLSKTSINSEWVKKEIEIASNREIEEKKVVVLPIVIENVELPGFLKGKFYGDFSDKKDYEEKLQLLLKSLGDSKPIPKTDEKELKQIRKELSEANKIIKQHQEKLDKVLTYSLSTKSDKLRERILSENKTNPEFAPINNVYAFEIMDIPITIGYMLNVLEKSRMRGGHQIEVLLTMERKWQEVDRMLEAYADMIDAQ